MDNLYVVTVEISSDSGAGPYSEEKTICNCSLKLIEGKPIFTAGEEDKPLEKIFHTGSHDFSLKILGYNQQSDYYYSY